MKDRDANRAHANRPVDGLRHLPADTWHAMACPIVSRWRRHRIGMPFWRDDSTARKLGLEFFGCRRCGRGAVAENEAAKRRWQAIWWEATR